MGEGFWRVGYGQEFARNVDRVADALEKQNKLLERIAVALEDVFAEEEEKEVDASQGS